MDIVKQGVDAQGRRVIMTVGAGDRYTVFTHAKTTFGHGTYHCHDLPYDHALAIFNDVTVTAPTTSFEQSLEALGFWS